jgi:hypothetical protein
VTVVVVAFAVLIGLAGDGSDTGASGSADDGSFEAATEDGSQSSAGCSTDEGSFTGTDASAGGLAVVIVVTVVVAIVVVLSATGSLPDALIVVGVVMLGGCGEDECEQQRGEK